MPEVRLFEYSVDKDPVSVPAETGIIEVRRPDGRVGRYLRTDGFDSQGRRRYGFLDAVDGPTDRCPTCRQPWDLYRHRLGDELGLDYDRRSLLLRCRDCHRLFEAVPDGRSAPRPLSLDEARRGFPGAV